MVGRGKKLRPPGAGVANRAHVSAKGARNVLKSGKVFRKSAGFPWGRAQTLG